jgi:hypothetical protein
MAEGEHGLWSFNADELVVFMADVPTVGHSTSKSTDGRGAIDSSQQLRVHDYPLPGTPTIGVS